MRKEFHERNSWPHRLMRISKATPVSASREWCSTRTMVSRKVTFIRRKTANTQTVCDNIQLASHLTVLLHDATIQNVQNHTPRHKKCYTPVSMVCANISSPSSGSGGSSDASGGSFRHSWASCMLDVMHDDHPWESQFPSNRDQRKHN